MTTLTTDPHLSDIHADLDHDEPAWITASVRPAGSFGRGDVGRLRALLDALSACASIVVLDLAATRLRSPRVASVIEDAARRLAESGGCLVCVHADPEAAARLSDCDHTVVMRDE